MWFFIIHKHPRTNQGAVLSKVSCWLELVVQWHSLALSMVLVSEVLRNCSYVFSMFFMWAFHLLMAVIHNCY